MLQDWTAWDQSLYLHISASVQLGSEMPACLLATNPFSKTVSLSYLILLRGSKPIPSSTRLNIPQDSPQLELLQTRKKQLHIIPFNRGENKNPKHLRDLPKITHGLVRVPSRNRWLTQRRVLQNNFIKDYLKGVAVLGSHKHSATGLVSSRVTTPRTKAGRKEGLMPGGPAGEEQGAGL